MRYDKNKVVKRDGRQLFSGGPRDQQRRMVEDEFKDIMSDQSEVIGMLQREINDLKTELSNQPKSRGEYTAEDLDEEINRELTKVIKEMDNKYQNEVSNLKRELAAKEDLLKEKDARIAELKQMPRTIVDPIVEEKYERPKFEEVFIDPLEKNAGSQLESHIKVREDSNKSDMSNKSDKLKKLFGKSKLNRR